MSFRILGSLLLMAAGGEALLLVTVGPVSPSVDGFEYATARQIGEEFGAFLLLLVVGAVGAGIAAFINRKAVLPTAAILVTILTLLSMAVRTAGQ